MLNRRGFLRALGAIGAGLLVESAAELLVPERKKIWAVGADFGPSSLRAERLQSPWILELPEELRMDPGKARVLCEYIKTTKGKEALAASMIQPLRARRDYQAIGRKTFIVEALPDSMHPLYSVREL